MSLTDTFDNPQSRVEAILQNAMGAEHEVVPQSRVEELLERLDDYLENIEGKITDQDEEIIAAVNAWLEDNPEATTAVQDGALSEPKFSNALKLKTIKDYVTPEMFGATGDGVADDSEIINEMIANNDICVMFNDYNIGSTSIVIPSNKQIYLFGSIEYQGGQSAIVLKGSNILFQGCQNSIITSYGEYGISTDGTIDRATIDCIKIQMKGDIPVAGVYLHSSNSNNFVGNSRFTNLYIRDERTLNNAALVGIKLHSESTGFVNENLIEKCACVNSLYAVGMYAEGTHSIDGNVFTKLNGESSKKQCYFEGNISGNVIELRTAEVRSKAGIIVINGLLSRNKFIFDNGIIPDAFTSDNTARSFITQATAPSNYIEGCLILSSGTAFDINPSFRMNGDIIALNSSHKYECYGNIIGNQGNNYSHVIDYSTVNSTPNRDIYTVNGITDFYLNGVMLAMCNIAFMILNAGNTVSEFKIHSLASNNANDSVLHTGALDSGGLYLYKMNAGFNGLTRLKLN